MHQPRDLAPDDAEPSITEMLRLIAEAQVAVRTLTELVPDPQAVEGLSRYVREALTTVAAGLTRLQSRS
jgi:hypothetical protein